MRKFLILLLTLSMGSLFLAVNSQSAAAWSREANGCNPCVQWGGGGSGSYYLRPSITAHSGWSDYIAEDIGKYNNIPGINNPTWSRTYTQSQALIEAEQVSLSSTLCGKTYFYWTGSNDLYYALIQYSSNKSYGGRNGASGNCNFDWTTMHEFGHSQGMGHSGFWTAIMNPSDNGVTNFHQDDLNCMAAIYS
mgnify:CR=1 FL=1